LQITYRRDNDHEEDNLMHRHPSVTFRVRTAGAVRGGSAALRGKAQQANGAAYEFRNALIGISEICAEPISAFNAETICHEKSHCNGSDLFSGVTTMLPRAMIALLAIVLIGLSPTSASARGGFGGFGGHGFGGGGWHGGGWRGPAFGALGLGLGLGIAGACAGYGDGYPYGYAAYGDV
jgi:hypothetical protein